MTPSTLHTRRSKAPDHIVLPQAPIIKHLFLPNRQKSSSPTSSGASTPRDGSRSSSPVRGMIRGHEVACAITGMTPMESGDAKFQTLSSDYEAVPRTLRSIKSSFEQTLSTANIHFKKCSIRATKGGNGVAGADLIMQSSGPPPIVLCNSLLETVLVSIVVFWTNDGLALGRLTDVSCKLSAIMNPLV
ncbi:hypothetical protein NliqN6_2928 [Naganishia liquefaciens]|uniref:Uncharacterized protein n=1 Tax=Naganishia liquefaciens TaxID=104408 RepID=A0A8H3TT78_9TREE|nr:hypothetical protein NliqN6_2928 [Naganishia liquefaciens]